MSWRRGELWLDTDILWLGERAAAPALAGEASMPLPSLAPPPGLSDQAVVALKTFRLNERVTLSGRLGEIAGAGLFDLSALFGKSDADNRQFLQVPRFVARIEALAATKKK